MNGSYGRDSGVRQERPYQPTGCRKRLSACICMYAIGGGKWGRLIEFGKSGVCVTRSSIGSSSAGMWVKPLINGTRLSMDN